MNRIEEIKQTKDGLDVLSDIYRYSRLGVHEIAPEDEPLFRWYGIYTQRPATDGYFMVRMRIPGGDLRPEQLRTIAALANEHGRGLADITVRQNIQLHWVRIESLADILDRLGEVGLSTTEACGDCVRNIINCPVSGVDCDELYDTTELIAQVNDFFVGNKDFSNLPRKFKITITGCNLRCTYPEINDIGLFAVRDEGGRVAFRARIGGGLSTSPRFSKDLGVMVDSEEVLELCGAIASVFRDEGDRTNRKRARLKFLVEKWEIPRFRQEVESRLGRRLRPAPTSEADAVARADRTHLGIHPQREGWLYYVGLSLMGGRTSGDALSRLADLADQYGTGRLRTTNTQNIILLDIPEWNLKQLCEQLDRLGFDYKPGWARRAVIACTGIQFCKLAIAETKKRAVQLSDRLEQAVDLDDSVRISVTGCPNSCGQHHICDVGLEGSLTTINGVKRETFQVFLGGGVGKHESFGRRIGVRIDSDELAEALARLFTRYKTERTDGETFQEYCLRHTDEQLAEYLSSAGATQ
ncbi:MAG TPA: nitrite/sulfite reductase [Blastocatellia bacterium]|nr:nitrite/sulfite reductase [Blastocatellia bacterium]